MPEPATLPRSGLFTRENTVVPLTGVSFDVKISDLCARVVMTQRFVNQEQTPIEALYVFPLDEGAAVSGFEAIIDGTLVVGEVREREEAFAMYDDAMVRGDGGFLLDEERPDVFQASVGNLPPGREVLLKLTYVTELAVEDESVRFVIPTTVSPRYAPAADRIAVGRPDAETLNPPVSWTVPYGLHVTVDLAMSGAVEAVHSPSHPIALALNGTRATVTLSQRDAALDRDFVLGITAPALRRPQAWIERDEDGSRAIAIAFTPKLPQTTGAAEVIFVVDRSGSMDGTSIAEVRNALQLCLRSMGEGCVFNIIGFGSTIDPLFPGTRDYNDDSLRDAGAHVATLEANLGGTELLPALERAFAQPSSRGLPRQIVVVTDGQVTNTDSVLSLAKAHAADARIFAFGIGAGASHHLVKGLARAGGGTAEFIYPGERIEPKVLRLFGRLLSPALTSVRVDWGGLQVIQAPSTVPPVFAGGRLLLYALMRNEPAQHTRATVRLMAEAPDGPATFEVPVDLTHAKPSTIVTTLAARARIRELEESSEWVTTRGSRHRDRKATGAAREMIELATRYGLISRETSYVAIERRDTPVLGDVQLRRVPVALTAGWGGLEMPRAASHGALRRLPMDTGVFALDEVTPQALNSMGTGRFRRFEPATAGLRARVSEAFSRLPRRGPAAPEAAAMQALIMLQRADGSWELTEEFATAVGHTRLQLDVAIAGRSGDPLEIRTAWATALAVAWLELNARHSQDEWRLLAAKARGWFARGDAEGWIERATEFLTGAG